MMAAIPRPMNPFIGGLLQGAPMLDQQALMSGVPMAQQGNVLANAPMIRPPMPMPQARPPQGAPMLPMPGMAPPPMDAPQKGGMLAKIFSQNGLGGDPGLAFAAGVLGGGSTGQALGRGFGNVLASRSAANGQTDDLKEYQIAKSQGYQGSFIDFLKEVKATQARQYGLTPIYAKDPKTGKVIALQVSNSGGDPLQMQAPEGYDILSPSELAGDKAQATALGKASGGAQAELGPSLIQAKQTVGYIDELLMSPAIDQITGPIDSRKPDWMLSDQARDSLARFNQLRGTAFLQAYQTLKGGGAITEVEGMKAEQAIARMDRAQNAESFKQALKDFRDAVDVGMQKLAARAGAYENRPQGGAPVGGDDIDALINQYAP